MSRDQLRCNYTLLEKAPTRLAHYITNTNTTLQSSVKSILKCKKYPYILNQNHIFSKKYYEDITR